MDRCFEIILEMPVKYNQLTTIKVPNMNIKAGIF
jgi:hypothetical protein